MCQESFSLEYVCIDKALCHTTTESGEADALKLDLKIAWAHKQFCFFQTFR